MTRQTSEQVNQTEQNVEIRTNATVETLNQNDDFQNEIKVNVDELRNRCIINGLTKSKQAFQMLV